MPDKLKEIAKWILEEGKNITREVLEAKLEEAYNQGRNTSFREQIDKTLDDIHYNTMQKIKHDKQVLLESNFYDKPTDKDIIQMKALEYLEEHIGEIIIKYKNNG